MKQLLIAASLLSAVITQAEAASSVPASNTPVNRTILAAASQTDATPSPARATPLTTGNSGLYIGAQLGDSTVGALLGYQLSRMFSMEISYDYVDPIYSPTSKRERSRVGASGLAMFPLKFSEMGPMALYVKVGYGRSTEKFTVNDPGSPPLLPATSSITTTTTTGVTGGAGIHVDLSRSASARLGLNIVGSDRSTYLAAMYKF